MCGIIACLTQEPSIDYLRIALRRLEYRGYDSVGVAVQTADGSIARLRTVGRVSALDRLVSEWSGSELGGLGIGHTRWATHGAVTEANAHPHGDCTGRISLVHNGVIANVASRRAALTRIGHRFASSVDSEVLCHLIEEELELCGDLFVAVQRALAAADGSWALAVLDALSSRIVVAAKGSPLLIAHTAHGDFATSDITAISDWADEFQTLEDGDVVDLSCPNLWSHRGVVAVPPRLTHCVWRGRDIGLHGYSDYTAKEIDEQPEAVARVLDDLGGGVADGSLWESLGLMPFDRLQVVGCGSSLNAGRVIGGLVRHIGAIPTSTIVGSEAGDELLEPHTLRMAISQSGETADILGAIESAGMVQPPLLALTNSTHSTLARRADAVVSCAAGPEVGVAATKTFVCQIVAGVAVMVSALVARRRLSPLSAARLVEELRRLPDRLAVACTTAKCVVPHIAEAVSAAEGFVFIARGTGLPYAAEGALKLKELTYRWAEHYPAGELKHGPLALIGEGTPVVVIDNADAKLSANVAEVEARGGHVIRIGAAGSTIPVVEDLRAPWGPLEAAVPLQILARTLALVLGRDVDRPRNLAKSVTVE